MEPPVVTKSTPLQCFKGMCYAALIVISSFLGSLYVLAPLLPLSYFRPKLFRYLVDLLVGYWLVLPSALMEYGFGVQLQVLGSNIDPEKPALIIMNHRTRLDWLFFWNALWRMEPHLLTSEKISLKGVLKYLPGAGWAMAFNAFLFLDRKFESDKVRIDTMVRYYSEAGRKYQLLLFPEGTDKCPVASERSRRFGEKSGLDEFKHLLHPRTLGFVYLLQKMRKERCVDFVYDVTVGYADHIVQTEVDLIVRGLTPKEVHFFVQKIPIGSLPEGDEELGEWLKQRWAGKEQLLHSFYREGGFRRQNGWTEQFQNFQLSPPLKLLQIAVLLGWLSATLLWLYMFFALPYQLCYAALVFMFVVGLQIFQNGLEIFLAQLAINARGE